MLAESRSLRSILASAEAKLRIRHEICPLVHLLDLTRESTREDKATYGIAITIRTMWVQFSSGVSLRDIYFGEVANTSNLDVIWCLHKVRTRDGTIRDKTCPISRLNTPRHFKALSVADSRICTRIRRREDTEVVDRVDVGVLTLRRLVGARPTLVRPGLSLLRVVRSVGGEVRRRVRLCADADKEEQGKDDGQHQGSSQGRGGRSNRPRRGTIILQYLKYPFGHRLQGQLGTCRSGARSVGGTNQPSDGTLKNKHTNGPVSGCLVLARAN